jgi:uncharacterized protein (TIGR00730 family)
MIKKVCVYCASSTQVDKSYLQAAADLGKVLSQNETEVIYGGGSIGSMGALANAVLENKGRLVGVIPKFMMELEWGNPHVTEMIVVETMAQRKQAFLTNVDAVVALPGGTGTLEELAEVLSLKKLGLFTQPIIIVNTNGFYDYLLQFLNKMIADKFIRPEHQQIYTVINDVSKIILAIEQSPEWNNTYSKLAAL